MNKLTQDSLLRDTKVLKKLIEVAGGRKAVSDEIGIALRTIDSWIAGERFPSKPIAFALMALAGLKMMEKEDEILATAATSLLADIRSAL